MTIVYTTGSWKPKPGSEGASVDAWAEFAAWASGMPGAGELRLASGSRGVREHVAEFQPDELALVATATHGAVTISH
jgi:hypothetical protein